LLLSNDRRCSNVSAVSPTSRRIFLYWLLLLVPTLVVGGGAIQLLRREQARLAERGASADEARRAAVAARARLIVENVELLVGDVEAGLLDALSAEPAAGLDAFLDEWERKNPLVRIAFRAAADGTVLRPDARTASEDARGFVRRFAKHFGDRPPWIAPAVQSPAVEKREQAATKDESLSRQEVSKNVAQVQSARRDVQELFKSQNAYASSDVAAAGLNSPPPLADRPASRAESTLSRAAESDRPAAPAARGGTNERARPGGSLASAPGLPAKAAIETEVSGNRTKDAAAERRGWVPAVIDGRLRLIGWVQPGGKGEVRGVEVSLAALISRLGGMLPAEPDVREGYALRDEQGRVLHQAGAIPSVSEPAIRVPLAAALLPGWDVTAYLTPAPSQNGNETAFWWTSVLLVGIFVAAILAGGSLLLWQARRSEEEATQKTSFVANVSHEFKTPLTTIRLYAELLEQGRVRDAVQETEYLRTIGRETQRLARLVNNALDFSRLEQGRKKYAREHVDLAAEVARLLETHGPRIAEAGLALHADLPAERLPVTTDRDAIGQILLNLIDNACKYAADGGELTVALRARLGGGVEIRVGDRGPGVPAEHRARIFEKFHRVDDALTAEKTGAGLGLSIARQLARGLGGELRYAPRTGAGAEFILELPRTAVVPTESHGDE
jgi:signal transduction histidine kinase